METFVKIIFLLSLIVGSFVNAQNYVPMTEQQCSTIDLRGDTCANGSARLPSLRNQGRTNYCSSFATIEIYSYATCHRLSALSMGILNDIAPADPSKGGDDTVNNGGSPVGLHARFAAQPNTGPCLESDFPSSPQEILVKLKGKNKFQRFVAKVIQIKKKKSSRSIASVQDDEEPSAESEPQEQVSTGKPSAEDSDANLTRYLMTFHARRNQTNPVGCTRQDISAVRISPSVPNARSENVLNRDLQLAINNALATHRGPAVLSIRADAVFDPITVNNTTRRPSELTSDHFINVVGRKWLNGHCHYLYRDSNPVNGASWPRAEDNPAQARTSLDSSNFHYLWVREENLLNNTDDVTYRTSPLQDR